MAEITGNEAIKGKVKEEYFIRFSARQRIEHAILMVSFIVLSITGLAQRYYTAGWGEWVILGLGGIEYTRLVHRIFGLIFSLSIIYHFSYVAYLFFLKRHRLTMVPTIKDFRDVVGALRHAFGFAEKPPLVGRFDYRQKFEYWGLILGGLVITVTGFILAFPVAITRILPGQIVAAAVEFHGYEATLAVLVIIIWHLYDVILRPGIFPADMTIFTGKISRERMIEEHPLEYEDMVSPQFDSEPDNPSPEEGQEALPGK